MTCGTVRPQRLGGSWITILIHITMSDNAKRHHLVTESNLIHCCCHENRDCEVPSPRQGGRQAAQRALRQHKQLPDKETDPRGNARPGDRLTVLYEIFVSLIVSVCVLCVSVCPGEREMCDDYTNRRHLCVKNCALLHVRHWPKRRQLTYGLCSPLL